MGKGNKPPKNDKAKMKPKQAGAKLAPKAKSAPSGNIFTGKPY